jgi:translation initiation factor 2B subunit (eIF-2B alpha/beta/delta family)
MFTVETTLKLIEDFQARSCLWDVASLDLTNRNKRRAAMHKLAIKYGISDPEMEKNHNLKSQFRKGHKKLKESNKSAFPLQSAIDLATNRYYSYSKGQSEEAVEAQIVKVHKQKMKL